MASLALAGGVMLTARPGAAYVQYQTTPGVGYAWGQNCVPIVVYPAGFSQMTPAAIATAASGAAAAWSAAGNSCTYLNLEVTTSTAPAPAVRNDGVNAVVFRTTSWCQMANGVCTVNYDPSVVSISTVTAVTGTGQIIDADVEVNAVDFNWTDVVAEPQSTGDQDLQNDLTEAFGHVIGLDAPCYPSWSQAPRPLDNNGQPAIDCSQASAAVQAETMFPAWPAGDTGKRTLAPDDQAALCGIYPLAANPRSCQVGAGTCACSFGDASVPTDGPTHDAGGPAGGSGNTHAGNGGTGGGAHDASTDGPAGRAASGGGCSSAGPPPPYRWLALTVVGLALVMLGRRRARGTAAIDRRPARDLGGLR